MHASTCEPNRELHARAKPRVAGAWVAAAVALACVASAGVLGGCRRVRRTPDDTLVVLIPNEIRDLDPRFAITNYDNKLSRLVAPGLMSVDNRSLAPRPELAQKIERVNDLTWDVTLRDGLRFSDGSPVTAADVVYTFESTLDPKTKSLYRKGFLDRFASVEALSRRKVRFHLVKPVATLLSDLDFGIISARAARAGGGRFPGGRVIGAGPFRIVSVDGDKLVLARNAYYYGKAPPMAKVIVRVVRDGNARALMLVGGSADLTQNGVRLDLVSEIAKRRRVKVETGPSAILTYLMMNNDDPVLSHVRVRRAIAYAIDRKRIIRAKLGGRAVLATGLLPPSHWAYCGDVARYPYDPARAGKLLDEAGYPDPDGPGGRPRFSLTYKTSSDPYRLSIARIIASELGKVGIAVEVRSYEFGTFYSDVKHGNYQLASMQTADITEPDYYFAYFNSSRIPTAKQPYLLNRWHYRNPRIDALTAQGRRTMKRARRVAIYAQVQKILARDLPIIPLWHEDNVAVMNVDVRGYGLFPSARFSGLAHASKRRR